MVKKNFSNWSFVEVVVWIEKLINNFLSDAEKVFVDFEYSGSRDKTFQEFFSGYLFDPADKDLLWENPEKVWRDYVKYESKKSVVKLVQDYFLYRVRRVLGELNKNGH